MLRTTSILPTHWTPCPPTYHESSFKSCLLRISSPILLPLYLCTAHAHLVSSDILDISLHTLSGIFLFLFACSPGRASNISASSFAPPITNGRQSFPSQHLSTISRYSTGSRLSIMCYIFSFLASTKNMGIRPSYLHSSPLLFESD